MERLTNEYCGEYVPKELCSIDRLGGADDCDLCCDYCKATEEGNEDCRGCAINQCFNKLAEYEDLEEQGKLMKLPCVVGDIVYAFSSDELLFFYVDSFFINKNGIDVILISAMEKYKFLSVSFNIADYGKKWFLTQEEAETVLKAMEL